MIELRFAADPAVWDPDLGRRIRGDLDDGRIVVWRSVSGAILSLTRVHSDGGTDTVGIRSNPHDRFDTDGLPLVLGRIDATGCGLWSPTGYRSARPITVHVLDASDDADAATAAAFADWRRTLDSLADPAAPHAWLEQVPPGHPDQPCPVAHCPLALAGAATDRIR